MCHILPAGTLGDGQRLSGTGPAHCTQHAYRKHLGMLAELAALAFSEPLRPDLTVWMGGQRSLLGAAMTISTPNPQD